MNVELLVNNKDVSDFIHQKIASDIYEVFHCKETLYFPKWAMI